MTIEKSEINRGDMLALPDYFKPTYMFNARLNLLSSHDVPLLNRTRVRLHLGTAEIICRIILLEKNELLPGESTFVQFRLEAPTVAEVGERYVVRSFSPMRTIGGGIIVEVHPQKLKWLLESEFERLSLLEQANPVDLVEQHLLKSPCQLFPVSGLAKELSFTR
jgi:selenocysteine-specific elongation factor